MLPSFARMGMRVAIVICLGLIKRKCWMFTCIQTDGRVKRGSFPLIKV